MNKISLILVLIIISTNLTHAQNELKYNLDSVIVTANSTPITAKELTKTLNIISNSDLSRLPVSSVDEALGYVNGIDIRQRGPKGVQSDIAIRGGTFEQTLIMVDGLKLTDPQTGHHNLNLPIAFNAIERIEILKGQGSNIFGANAFSGVVNIITKKNFKNATQIELQGGENGYHKIGVNGSLNLYNTNHHFSISQAKSDGYRSNTDFKNSNISFNSSFRLKNSIINTILGFVEKDFGANSFYIPESRFPIQAEVTTTKFAGINADIEIDNIIISPKAYWRGGKDHYEYGNPNYQLEDRTINLYAKNKHNTNVYGGEIKTSINNSFGATSIGIEYVSDEIESNNLGKHNRNRKGIFAEQKLNIINRITLNFGGSFYNYSNIGWKFWPGFDIAYRPTDQIKFYANFGKAFRVPTYTEMFLTAGGNVGNPNLRSEESTSYEIGFNLQNEYSNYSISVFRKEGKNLIDWGFNPVTENWEAQNLTSVNTNGIELGTSFYLNKFFSTIPIQLLQINYTYIDAKNLNSEILSRYVFDHLNHQISAKLVHNLAWGINISWNVTYADRESFEDHLLLDTKIIKVVSPFEVSLSATNILNNRYENINGLPLPGRWIIGGVKFNLF